MLGCVQYAISEGFVQGEDEDDVDDEDDEEDEEDEEEDILAKNLRKNDVDMEGPTRDELEQAAEEEFNLSQDEDMEPGMATLCYIYRLKSVNVYNSVVSMNMYFGSGYFCVCLNQSILLENFLSLLQVAF